MSWFNFEMWPTPWFNFSCFSSLCCLVFRLGILQPWFLTRVLAQLREDDPAWTARFLHSWEQHCCSPNAPSQAEQVHGKGAAGAKDERWKFKKKQWINDNTKGIPIHESLWMPRTCGLIHPLFNYSGDHQCHGYCMILWCWGCPNGRTDPECPVHVDSPTPCLIILVTINPMNIMVPKVSWWMNVQ